MIGKKIKELRKKNKMTQKELSSKLGVSPAALGLWETDKRTPDFNILTKISDIFNVPIDYLIKENLENEVIILGRDGTHTRIKIDEKSLKVIENLANSLKESFYEN